MRIVVVWHAAVVAEYRERFRAMLRANPSLDLHIVVPGGSHEMGEWTEFEGGEDGGYSIHRVDSIWTRHPNALFYKSTFRKLRSLTPDILHVHEEPWTFAAAQFTALFKSVCPIVLETYENLPRELPPHYALVERWVLPRVTSFLAVPGAQRVLREKGVRAPLYTGAYGTRLPHAAVPRNLNKVPRVGFLGRLNPEKGIDTLLQASRHLQIAHELIIIGSGPMMQDVEVESIQRPSVVRLARSVSHENALATLIEMDVLVLPSRTTEVWAEQFGRVLIEAMAVGTPVIGSDSGEIPWVIGGAGLIFHEGDSVDLADKLTQLMVDPEIWIRFSKAALHRAATVFSWDAVAGSTIKVYEDMLGIQQSSDLKPDRTHTC